MIKLRTFFYQIENIFGLKISGGVKCPLAPPPCNRLWPPLCRPNLTQRRNTIILILILSDDTFNFGIGFVAMISLLKNVYRTENHSIR